jgi:hypothetical protein
MLDGAAAVDRKEKGATTAMEDGGSAATVEKGVITVDPEKGAAAVVEEGGGRALASDILALLPVSCTHGVR